MNTEAGLVGTLSQFDLLSADAVDLLNKREVDICDPAPVVRRRSELRVTPAEAYVRVMVRRLGDLTNLIYESKALSEV